MLAWMQQHNPYMLYTNIPKYRLKFSVKTQRKHTLDPCAGDLPSQLVTSIKSCCSRKSESSPSAISQAIANGLPWLHSN